ncbi:hypothetical protein Emed_004910 [Eimeria media]
MGEASPGLSRSSPTREPSNISSSSFPSLHSAAASQELGLPVRNRRLRSRWGISSRLVLAAIASAAAVAVLISLCAAAYLRAAPLQLTRRRLSEGGSPESSKGLAVCGETSGDASDDDLQPPFQEEEPGLSPAKRAKVEDEGAGSDAEAGFQAKTSTSSQDELDIASAGAAATAPEVESPLQSRMSPDEMMAAEALVALWGEDPPASPEQTAPGLAFHGPSQLAPDLPQQVKLPSVPWQEGQHAPASQQEAQLPPAARTQTEVTPLFALLQLPSFPAVVTVTDSAVASSMGVVSWTPAGAEGPHIQPALVQLAATRPGAILKKPLQRSSPGAPWSSRAIHVSSNGGLEEIDPLGEWEPPAPSEAGPRVVLEHAFSRLPRVVGGEHSSYGSLFCSERATKAVMTMVQAPMLRELSTLLAQEELSLGQLRVVGELAERLVNHLVSVETRALARYPALAVEALGFRFLLLDMTVSSLQLLGVPRSGPWWDEMVSRIPDEYANPLIKSTENLPSFNFHLATRLTAAIRTLKSGHRPEPKVLVHLKRCLFCCKHSPLRFLKPAWDRWREDNRLFYAQFEGGPGQSDPAQPGPSHQSSS